MQGVTLFWRAITLKSQHVQHPKASFNISQFVCQSFSFVESSYLNLGAWCHQWNFMKALRPWHLDHRLGHTFAEKLYILRNTKENWNLDQIIIWSMFVFVLLLIGSLPHLSWVLWRSVLKAINMLNLWYRLNKVPNVHCIIVLIIWECWFSANFED